MAKDNAVRNQKVFVSLGSVLELQQRYLNVVAMAKSVKLAQDPTSYDSLITQKRTLESIISLLELPINEVQIKV